MATSEIEPSKYLPPQQGSLAITNDASCDNVAILPDPCVVFSKLLFT